MREKRYDKGMKGTGKTYSEPEEKKAKEKEEIREVFAIEGNGKRELHSGF